MAFHQSWVWWERSREPVVQPCLVHHDPEPCPTVWARWCEWRFWQQGMCSGVDLLHWDRFSSQYRGSTSWYLVGLEDSYRLSRLGQSHRDSQACSPHSCMSLRDWGFIATPRDVYISMTTGVQLLQWKAQGAAQGAAHSLKSHTQI